MESSAKLSAAYTVCVTDALKLLILNAAASATSVKVMITPPLIEKNAVLLMQVNALAPRWIVAKRAGKLNQKEYIRRFIESLIKRNEVCEIIIYFFYIFLFH